MKEYWANLQPRERQVLIIGLAVAVPLLFLILVWEPILERRASLQERVTEQRDQLAWMQQAAQQIATLQAQGGQKQASPGQSLLTLVDSSARRAGLGDAIKRIQPEGQGEVRVWLDAAPFDPLLGWLDGLSADHGVSVKGVVVERAEGAGLVNVRLVLEGGV